MKATEKTDNRRTTGPCPRRPVLMQYVLAWRENGCPKLLRVPLGFGKEALLVFSSVEVAHDFASSDALGQGWHVRVGSAGELVSLLLGPYAGVEWVLLDPLPGCLAAENPPANLMRWEDYIDYLLG